MNKTSFLKLLVFILFFAITTLLVNAENGISQDKENDSGYSEIEKTTEDPENDDKVDLKENEGVGKKIKLFLEHAFGYSAMHHFIWGTLYSGDIGTHFENFGYIPTFGFAFNIEFSNWGVLFGTLFQRSQPKVVIEKSNYTYICNYTLFDIYLHLSYKIKVFKHLYFSISGGFIKSYYTRHFFKFTEGPSFFPPPYNPYSSYNYTFSTRLYYEMFSNSAFILFCNYNPQDDRIGLFMGLSHKLF